MTRSIQRLCLSRGPRAQAGFTLIELIMTMVVIGIVSVPLSYLITSHLEGVFLLEDDTMAQNLARFELEKVNNMAYANINAGTVTVSNYQGYAYDVTTTVSFVQGDAGSAESLKKVQVDVKESGNAKVNASLTTYLAKGVDHGI